MRGEEAGDPGDAPSGQPPHVLATWIRRRLDELRGARLARLAQLCARLQSEAFEWDHAPLTQALSVLQAAGRQLHFLPLRQGWIARLLGRHRAPYARFIAASDRIVACAGPARAQMLALTGADQHHTAPARQALVELDAECQRLDSEIDQGVTWLQEMCAQLAGARERGNADHQLESLAESAQRFTREFRWLESVSTMARDLAVRGHNVLRRRMALAAQVRVEIERFDTAWTDRVGGMVDQLRAGRSVAPAIPGAIAVHDEMMKRLAAARDACGALQHEEHLLAQQLDRLQRELQESGH